MSDSYDIVIIGGGIIGAAIAYHLAERKYGKIAVLEKDQYLGNGATAKCAGGIRAQFSSEINVRLSSLSEDKFESFSEDMDCDVQFEQVGYLFVVTSEEQEINFRSQFEMWQKVGHPAEWLSRDDIIKFVPSLRNDDIIGGTFSKRDGIGDPHQFTQGYVNAARRLGVKFLLETEALGINHTNNKITSVVTNKGEISTSNVVNAAGPFAAKVASWLDIDLPVKPYKRQIVTTAPLDFIDDKFPMVVDIGSGLYTHRESGGLLMGWADPDEHSGFDESTDPDYTDTILMKGLDRIPQLETAQIKTAWGGLYSVTPDHLAILGSPADYPGFYQAVGFSGHGFMHAPAVGIVLSEIITASDLSINISSLALERFKDKQVKSEKTVI